MSSRWELKKDIKEKYKPFIADFLNNLENLTKEEVENSDDDIYDLDLSNTELNPYTLLTLLKEEFGYTDEEFDHNGWELDYWITIKRPGKTYPSSCENLTIRGCGMTFELILSAYD